MADVAGFLEYYSQLFEIMGRVVILYFNFIGQDGRRDIGGIETYMYLLSKALYIKYQVHIVFPAGTNYQFRGETFTAHGIRCSGIEDIQKILVKNFLQPGDILIFATEQIVPVIRHPFTLAIQHGIYWDLPVSQYRHVHQPFLGQVYKLFDNYRNIDRTGRFNNLVCVDHQFPGWRRTLVRQLDEQRYHVILNCADDAFFKLEIKKPVPGQVTVLFPRRFVGLRGCLLFVRLMQDLLPVYPQLRVLLAGEGPLEAEMKMILPPGERVRYVRAEYHEMPGLMENSDIVMVPSLGSEGSSLAVAEGLAAGKIVIASNVGGITNMIIHGYNGLLCRPLADDFRKELELFFADPDRYHHLQINARNTASSAFSFATWSEKWLTLLDIFRNGDAGS